ncbi:MAG: hypothetical protein JXQ71_02200, partial [Verrucomicrobia bacterium]|nr:hypothetical protein [Verrucomicrobiota bacterium]
AALAPGAATNFTGSFPVPANLNACAIANTLAVTGRDKCSGTTVSSTVTRTCPVISAPSIQVTKTCPETPVAPGGVLTFGGSVRNDGNVTLSNVTVVVDRPSPGTVVYTVASLEPGATASFAGSYPAPLNECSVTDTLTATAVDRCGNPVSDRTTTLCALTTTPRLAISRTCPPPVPPGGQMVLQGWVTNTGNITLTNVTVVIDRPAANTRVFGPVTLVPGQAAPFQGSFTVPADIAACSITSMLTVRGNDLCTGASVSSMAAATCPLLTSPRILVTKSCPAAPTPQGSPLVFSGTVANIGDSVLTNIVVVNNQPASNTVVFAALRLLPGQMTNFTGSYIVPTNCCEVCDTLTASGRNECNGLAVYDTATAICPVKFAPQIRITKTCPEQPTPIGEVLTYSGVVSNAGNVTLSDVVAYHSITGKRHRILEVAALAPGEAEFFTASFTVPEDFCEPDTVAVEARSICGNTPVTDSVTSACPVETAPNIDIVEVSAAQPVSAGQPGTFVGTVVNSGNVTLTNVVVAGSMPAPNTLVLGPLTLVPGETRVFSHSYAVPQDCNCCLLVNSYTARGWNRCESVQVAATTTIVTPYLTRPGIVVSLECPAGSSPGQTASVAGRVMNSGDVALTNVVVVRDGTTRLAGPISLVRGETHDFVTPYTPGAVVNVVATANDACTGATVSDADLCGAPLITSIAVAEGTVTLRWTSQPGTTYRVQSHANLIEGAWGNEPGDVTSSGTTCTKTLTLPAGTESRFYRVLVVPST